LYGAMMKNPPKSPFAKGDLKEIALFYKPLPKTREVT